MNKISPKEKKMLSRISDLTWLNKLSVIFLFFASLITSLFSFGQTATFDLALTKSVNNYKGFQADTVTYNIEVFNQGSERVYQVQVTDYVPNGLILADTSWVVSSGKATLKKPIDSLSSSSSVVKTIRFLIDKSFKGIVVNTAEISAAKDKNGVSISDIDSTLDDNPANDGTGEDDFDTVEIEVLGSLLVTGAIYDDINKNGVLDEGENGISGIEISVLNQSADTSKVYQTTTDTFGRYSLVSPAYDSVTVNVSSKTGYDFPQQYSGWSFINHKATKSFRNVQHGDTLKNVNLGLLKQVVSCTDSIVVTLPTVSICAFKDFSLGVRSQSGSPVEWYTAPVGGSPVRYSTKDSIVVLNLAESTQYYLQPTQTNQDCPHNRVPLFLFVNPKPAVPQVTPVAEVCKDSLVNLSSLVVSAPSNIGDKFSFYADSLREVSVDSLVGAGKYFVFQEGLLGCISNWVTINVTSVSCDSSAYVDLSLIKDANKRSVFVNEEVEYTITLHNKSINTGTNIEIADKLPDGLQFISSDNFVLNQGVLSIKIDSINGESSLIFKYKAKPTKLGSIVNYAEILKVDQKDPNSTPGNGVDKNEDDDDDEAIWVIERDSVLMADLSLSKTVNKNIITQGDNVTYTISITNKGPALASNIEVRDILPVGAIFVRGSGPTISVSGKTITATFDSIGVNSSKQFTIEAKLDSVGTIINRAEVSSVDQEDPNSTPGSGINEDDDDSVSVSVLGSCNLPMPVISANRNYVCSGDSITLSAVGCANVIWSNGRVGSSVVVNPTSNTTYTAFCQNGTCRGPISNSVLISLSSDAKPSVTASAKAICFGQSVTLTVSGCLEGVKWSNGATEDVIIVKPSVTTTYSATCTGGGCDGNESNPVVIEVSNSTVEKVEVNSFMRNVCPTPFVNLNSAVLKQPSGTTLVFKDGILPSSPNADSLIYVKGLFFVYAQNAAGCLSEAAGVTVDIIDCGTGGLADLSLRLIADKDSIIQGDTVSFTAVLKNNGPQTAKSIKVRGDLLTGFDVVESNYGLDIITKQMLWNVDSLLSGATDTLTYKARVRTSGSFNHTLYVNSLTSDLDSSNNTASVKLKVMSDVPCLAASLFADTLRNSNNSYTLCLTTYLMNCGNASISSVQAVQDLSKLLEKSVDFSVQNNGVSVNSGSSLIVNQAYDGKANLKLLDVASSLDPGDIDTITVRINVTPNGVSDIFYLNTVVSGEYGSGNILTDTSNAGQDIIKYLSTPTEVSFGVSDNRKLASILNVKNTESIGANAYKVTFESVFRNLGSNPVTEVVVVDSLHKYLPNGFTVSNLVSSGELKVNPEFDGKDNLNLTLATSTLEAGKTDTLSFVVSFTADTTVYYNQLQTSGKVGADSLSVLSNWSSNILEVGSNPTRIDITDLVIKEDYCIGLSLAATEKAWQPDGSLNVVFVAQIANCGLKGLSNVTLCDTLSNGIADSAIVTLLEKPILSAGSKLTLDSTFNGSTNTCLIQSNLSFLDSASVDTIKYTVNIKPNSALKYVKSLVVKAKGDSTVTVEDVSNDGLRLYREGSAPTVVVLDSTFNNNMIGLAKKLESVSRVDSTKDIFNLRFKFTVKNYSERTVNNLKLQDDLAEVFGDSVSILSVNFDSVPQGWVSNPNYDGAGESIDLLSGNTSSIAPLSSESLIFTVRVELNSKNKLKFENFGLVIGDVNGGEVGVNDASSDGENPDTNLSGSPKDDSVPTLIDLSRFYEENAFVPLGIAKSGHAELTTTGGTRITYSVIVKNYGDKTLEDIQLLDDLSHVFRSNAQFVVLDRPKVNKDSKLIPNLDFNGAALKDIVLEGSILEAGKQDTVTFSVGVFNTSDEAQTYRNQVQGKATSEGVLVEDLSVSGDNPDADEDGNPGNDSGYTINIIDSGSVDTTNLYVVVAEGVSPNNDGVNDVFTIKEENGAVSIDKFGTVTLEIVNRWGHPVYKSDDYIKDYNDGKGWAGTANTGAIIGSGSKLPDGTYYYILSSSENWVFGGKKRIGFVTLKR